MRLLADCTVYDRADVLSSRTRFGQFRVERMVLDPGLISNLSSRSLVTKSENHSEINIALYRETGLKGLDYKIYSRVKKAKVSNLVYTSHII